MLTLNSIEKRSGLNRETFAAEYLHPLQPVVFTDLMDQWPAKTNWTIDKLKQNYGLLEKKKHEESKLCEALCDLCETLCNNS